MAETAKKKDGIESMSLATKLATIGRKIGAVDKKGMNTQQKYNFIEYSEVASRVRTLFDEYHVIIIPEVVDVKFDEVTNKYGGKGYHYILTMDFTIVNGDNAEDRECMSWLGEATDYGDKGINKAETAGTKYFLMRLFNISEKGDDDPDKTTPAESVNPEVAHIVNKFSEQEIATAKLHLGMCDSEEKLKTTYKGLGEIAKHPEIIKYTNQKRINLKKGE